jgi:hypothetical protein
VQRERTREVLTRYSKCRRERRNGQIATSAKYGTDGRVDRFVERSRAF